MEFDRYWILATMALGGGTAMFASGFRDFRLKRLIQNTPTARIRSMAMGLVEVNGVIECRSTVYAPFSGRACAVWNVDISARGRNNHWTVVHRATSGQPFFLRDETGVALVYPRGAQCSLNFATEEVCHGLTLPECYSSYVSTLGPRRHLWRVAMLRFRERVLDEGTKIYVLGTATPAAQSFTVSDGEGMVAASEDALAATGTDEWRARRVRAKDEHVSAVVRAGEHEKAFFISQDSERTLTIGLGLKAMAKLTGGPLITLLGLGYWLHALSHGASSR